jgi:hypothetical protein
MQLPEGQSLVLCAGVLTQVGGRGSLTVWKGERKRNINFEICVRSRFYGQATKGVCVDALAQTGDEGRGQLR